MFLLFLVVAVAVLILSQTRFDGARPWGLALVGVLSVVLGLRAAMLVTESSSLSLRGASALAEERTSETPVAEVTLPSEIISLTETADQSASGETGDQQPAADEPGEIKPITHVIFLDRDKYPRWLQKAADFSEFQLVSDESMSEPVQFVVADSGLYSRLRQCERALDVRIKEAADEYINDYLESRRAAMLLRYGADEIKSRLVRDTFAERIEFQYGLMREAHALLAFDDDFRGELDERWNRIRAGSRLMQTGLGTGVVLFLLGTLFGYLRLDTATRGYYTGRLQFAAAAAILAVVAAGVLVANWIPWM